MFLCITGNEQHSQVRTKRGESDRNRASWPLVYTDVRHQDVDMPISLLDRRFGCLFRAGLQNAIRAIGAKNKSQHLQHCGIVIKD